MIEQSQSLARLKNYMMILDTLMMVVIDNHSIRCKRKLIVILKKCVYPVPQGVSKAHSLQTIPFRLIFYRSHAFDRSNAPGVYNEWDDVKPDYLFLFPFYRNCGLTCTEIKSSKHRE